MAKEITRDIRDKKKLLKAIEKECLEKQKWTTIIATTKEDKIGSLPIKQREIMIAEAIDEWRRRSE